MISYTFFPQLKKTLLIVSAVVALVPFRYVVTRPAEVREKRCLPTKSLQINDSTSRIRINYQIFKVASKTPSYVQIVQLFCKTGYFLALNVTAKKNRIIGIVNQSSESSKSLIILTSLPSSRGEYNSIVILYGHFVSGCDLQIDKTSSISLLCIYILLT